MPVHQQIVAALWGLGIATVSAVTIWLVVSNAWYRTATQNRIPETDIKPTPIGIVDEYPEGLAEAHGGPTIFLRALMILFVLWTVGYVAMFILHNG